MKNAELEALLKERSLPHTGKKAEMVARLQEDDKQKAAAAVKPAAPSATAPAPEDEIDWDDEDTAKPAPAATAEVKEIQKEEAKTATTEAAAQAMAAGGQGRVANPQAVPNQVPDTDPSTTDDLSVKPANGSTDAAKSADAKAEQKEEKPAVDYSRGLATTTLEEEIEKRRARAKKFNLPFDEKAIEEQVKKLERAQKFGNEAEAPKGLNEALPERRKRGRDEKDEGGRGGSANKRRGGRFDGRHNNRRNKGRGGNRDEQAKTGGAAKTEGASKQNTSGASSWMSEVDRAKAEARKAKFAAQPSASV